MTKYISAIVTIVVIIVVGVLVYTQWNSVPVPVGQPTATTTVVVPLPAPVITGATLGTALTPEGTVINPTTTFKRTDNIFAGLSLENSLARAPISYIRTYNGKYVDSKVSHVTEDGVKNFHFAWTLAAGKARLAGNYSLTFYINGVKSQTINYTVK